MQNISSLYKYINIDTGEKSVSLDIKSLKAIILGLRKDGISLIKIYGLTYNKKHYQTHDKRLFLK